MSMTPNLPLVGKRIVVTRAAEQAPELVRALESLGAQVLLLPLVTFTPPEDWRPVDSALERIATFDWVLFTSQNAVRFFAGRAAQLHREKGWPRPPKIAAVGPATASAAEREGFQVDHTAQEHSGEGLSRELSASLAGRSVLLPRSDRADSRLPDALLKIGAQVTEVIAYRTAPPNSLDSKIVSALAAGSVDAIVFASPSAFHNVAGLLGAGGMKKLSESAQFAAIGPTTASAIRAGGAHVEIEAEESSAAGLADAIAKHFQQRSETARRA
ncbi:MAG: uroporphyrinogen-III synthase [Acidobacteriia bacterium]|nr:uroporphyrinogen-III synthase [Terriglobia bacterium]